MKQKLLILASIPLLLLTACSRHSTEAGRTQTVKIDTAALSDEQSILQFPGKVKAAQDISLSFRVDGVISKILVTDGQRVRKGQLLAMLDPTDYQVQLNATEAEYKQVKAEAERVMALYAENGVTPNDNDKAVYGLRQITAKYKHHQDQLSYTRLPAPFDGYIQQRLFEAHETVGAGTPVLSMVSADAPEVEIFLPAAEYIRREQFDRYSCTFDIFPGKVYPLQPISVAPKANANQLYAMRLRMTAKVPDMPSPGMNTMVTILPKAGKADILSVPSSAVWQKEDRSYVFQFVPEEGVVHRRQVTPVRLLSNGRTLVTSSELTPGTLIVASGVHSIQEGEEVTPLPMASKTNVGGLL